MVIVRTPGLVVVVGGTTAGQWVASCASQKPSVPAIDRAPATKERVVTVVAAGAHLCDERAAGLERCEMPPPCAVRLAKIPDTDPLIRGSMSQQLARTRGRLDPVGAT